MMTNIKLEKTLDGVSVFKLSSKLNDFITKNNVSRIIISTEKIPLNRQKYIFNYFKNSNIQLFKLLLNLGLTECQIFQD